MALGDTDELNAYVGIAREHCILEENGLEDFLKDIQSRYLFKQKLRYFSIPYSYRSPLRLMDIGSAIATPLHSSDAKKLRHTTFPEAHTEALEAEIDRLDSALPTLKNFILPGGGMASSSLHVCRTICRRAEVSTHLFFSFFPPSPFSDPNPLNLPPFVLLLSLPQRKACALRDEDSVEHAVCLYLNRLPTLNSILLFAFHIAHSIFRLSDFFFVAARHASNHIGCPDTIYKKSRH